MWQQAQAGSRAFPALQVEAKTAQASMQDALAQTIGSRNSSTTALPPPPVHEGQQSAAEEGSTLGTSLGRDHQSKISATDEAAEAEASGATPSPAAHPMPESAHGEHALAEPSEQLSADGPASPAAGATAAAEEPSGNLAPPAAALSIEDHDTSPAVLPGELQRTHTGDPEEDAEQGTASASAAATPAIEAGQQVAAETEPATGEPRAPAAASGPLAAELPRASVLAARAGDAAAGAAAVGQEAVGPLAADVLHLVAHR